MEYENKEKAKWEHDLGVEPYGAFAIKTKFLTFCTLEEDGFLG
jgi:hypothetical protein